MSGSRLPDTNLSNWRLSPYSQWAFQHVRELIPTAEIRRSLSSVTAATDFPLKSISLPDSDEQRSLEQFLLDTHTDSFILLRNNEVKVRWSASHCDLADAHIVFSISKSITGMLAGILVDKGVLDTTQSVFHYLPQTEGSAYHDCTVQQLLDMTVALDFEEDYLNPTGDYFRYRNATCWNPVDQTADSLTLEQFLYTIGKADFSHGEKFNYKSPNTDLMGLVIERAAGKPFAQLMSELLWQPIGSEGPAYVTLDRAMTARTAGGICVTVDDLARFGQVILNGGNIGSQTIIPPAWVVDTMTGGDADVWQKGDMVSLIPKGRYHNYWYQIGDDQSACCAIGIHGQWLYINPATHTVIVKLSSQPEPLNEPLDLQCLAEFKRLSQP